jgi:zinc finger-containing ubiquitin peptidase 1
VKAYEANTKKDQTVPDRVYRALERGPESRHDRYENEIPSLKPTLESLLLFERRPEDAKLCSSPVRYTTHTRDEGEYFHDYQNIRMLLSSLNDSGRLRKDRIRSPSNKILDLQRHIEEAWHQNPGKYANASKHFPNGKLQGTKHPISVMEVAALCDWMGVGYIEQNFDGNSAGFRLLFNEVKEYFNKPTSSPIFLSSRPGESLTIIGYQIKADGTTCLIKFDPSRPPDGAMDHYLQKRSSGNRHLDDLTRAELLKPYRFSERAFRADRGIQIIK